MTESAGLMQAMIRSSPIWRRDRHLVAVCKEFNFIANAMTIILAVRQVGLL